MVQAIKVRLPDGRVVSPSDWTSAPLFSTVEVGTGNQQPLPAFSYGEQGQVPGSVGPRNATQRDTNMQGQGGILQENEEVLMYALQVEVIQTYTNLTDFFNGNDTFCPDPPEVSATNLLKLQRSTLLRVKIANTKDYGVMPLSFFSGAQGIQRTTGSTRRQGAASDYTNGVFTGYNGGVSVMDQREWATPHHIGPGEAFEATLEFPYGAVTEPLPTTAGQVTAAGSALNFGADTNARLRVCIYVIGPRRRPVA